MGLEAGTIAAIGLAVSAVGTGYSIYASEQAAKEAESIADDNAQREAMEAEEMAQRAEEAADRENSLARAKAAASGAGGESSDLYLEDLESTKQREIDWIRRSGASRSSLISSEGSAKSSGIRAEGVGDLISGLGGTATGGLDWYNTYG